MRISLIVIIGLILLVLTSFVSAADISSVSVTDVQFFVGDSELFFVSEKHPQTVDMFVEVEANNLDSIYADLSQLNLDPQSFAEYNSMKLSCSETNTSNIFICSKNNIFITPVYEKINISFDVAGENLIYTYIFDMDNTNPLINSIKTNYCDEDTGRCFVKSGGVSEIDIYFSDSKGTFNQNKIFYSLGGELTRRVSECVDFHCFGSFVSSCSSGELLETTISRSGGFTSSDDAGNIFEGEFKTVFYCDEEAPKLIGDVGVNFDNNKGIFDSPKQGDIVTIWAIVEEDMSGLNAYGNFSDLLKTESLISGDCSTIGESEYNCSWIVSEILPGDHYLDFEFEDGVGRNSSFTSQMIHVDSVAFAGNGSTPKVFSDFRAELSSSEGYNRIMIGLAVEQGIDYPIFASYNLKKQISGNVEALYSDIDLTTCVYEQDGEEVSANQAFDFKLANPLSDYEDTNRINLVFKGNGAATSINDIASEFNLKCNMSVLVKINGKVYQEPTNLEFVIPMKFRNSALGDTTPGKAFADKIIDWETKTQKRWAMVEKLNEVAIIASSLCNLDGLMADMGMGGTLMQLAGKALGGSNSVAGSSLSKGGEKVINLISSITLNPGQTEDVSDEEQDKRNEASADFKEFVSRACEFMRCNVEDRMKQSVRDDGVKNQYFTAGEDFGEMMKDGFLSTDEDDDSIQAGILSDINKEIFEDVSTPNVKESMVSAVLTQCYPAMLYHLNQFRQADCQVVSCLKINAKTGGDLAMCEQLKGQFYCQKFLGEMFELPYIREAKNVVENTKTFIQLAIPNTIKIATKNTICKPFLGDDGVIDANKVNDASLVQLGACTLPQSIGKVMNFYEKNSVSGTDFIYPVEEDACAIAFCDKEDIRECEGVTNDMAEKMLGFSTPRDVDFDKEEREYTYAEIIKLLEDSRSSDADGTKAKKDLAKLPIDFCNSCFETDPSYADQQIAKFEALKKASSSDYISLDKEGNTLISFSEWEHYGNAYEEYKKYSTHVYLTQKWSKDITNNYVSFLEQYGELKAKYSLAQEEYAKEDVVYNGKIKKINDDWKVKNKPLEDRKTKLETEIGELGDINYLSGKTYDELYTEYVESASVIEKACLESFKIEIDDLNYELKETYNSWNDKNNFNLEKDKDLQLLDSKIKKIDLSSPSGTAFIIYKNIDGFKIYSYDNNQPEHIPSDSITFSRDEFISFLDVLIYHSLNINIGDYTIMSVYVETSDGVEWDYDETTVIQKLSGYFKNTYAEDYLTITETRVIPAGDGIFTSYEYTTVHSIIIDVPGMRISPKRIYNICESIVKIPEKGKRILEIEEGEFETTTTYYANLKKGFRYETTTLFDENTRESSEVKERINGFLIDNTFIPEYLIGLDGRGEDAFDSFSENNDLSKLKEDYKTLTSNNGNSPENVERYYEISDDLEKLEKQINDLETEKQNKLDELEEPVPPGLADPSEYEGQFRSMVNEKQGDEAGDKIYTIFTKKINAKMNKYSIAAQLVDGISSRINYLESMTDENHPEFKINYGDKEEELEEVKKIIKKLKDYREEIAIDPEKPVLYDEEEGSSGENGASNIEKIKEEFNKKIEQCGVSYENSYDKNDCGNYKNHEIKQECLDAISLYTDCLEELNSDYEDSLFVSEDKTNDDSNYLNNKLSFDPEAISYKIKYDWKPDFERMDIKYLEEKNRQRAINRMDKISDATDLIASFAKEMGWLDWMSLRNWKPDSNLGKFSGWLDSYFSSDSWKQSICSPGIIKNNPAMQSGGAVIQCQNNLCKPVFTQASEKTKYNDTHYIYALTYYIGSVSYPESYNENNPIKYNVYMKGGVSLYNDLFTETQELMPGDYHEFQKAFPSTNNYDEICFVFNSKFPPNEANGKTMFCREIIDADDSSMSSWDTGRPTSSEEYQLPSQQNSSQSVFKKFMITTGI